METLPHVPQHLRLLTCTQSSQHECAGRPREPHGPAASAAAAPSHSQACAPGQQLRPPGFVCALIRPAPPPAPALPPAAPLPTARLYGELPGGSGAMRGARPGVSARRSPQEAASARQEDVKRGRGAASSGRLCPPSVAAVLRLKLRSSSLAVHPPSPLQGADGDSTPDVKLLRLRLLPLSK